jgi:polyisoprenoid-binding protein YceI
MKRIIASFATILLLSQPFIASASTWNIDPDHSSVGFQVRHLMVSNVKGTFEKYSGVLNLDDKEITRSTVQATIDAKSINTNVQKRDEHLRSADFFDVEKYPSMTFVSKKITRAGKDRLKIAGDLTLHGVTRPVVLDVVGLSKESKDPWGNLRRGATATTKINRKDFGLTWNTALETGGVAVGEEVTVNLEIELIRK